MFTTNHESKASISPEKLLGIDTDDLKSRESFATAREITQQPRVWREAAAAVAATREKIDAWLQPKLGLPHLQVLFCGAGTSAFIGDSVAAWINGHSKYGSSVSFESVGTTDLVANPAQYFRNDPATLIVSFARSGDSPESVASVNLADANLSQCFHLVLTCNPDGQLAQYVKTEPSAYCILMPEGTNDEGFAMTSSYSSMLVTCLAIFTPDEVQLDRAANYAMRLINDHVRLITAEAETPFDRLVVLGSGCLKGTAREAALKCLELAGGKVMAISDTPLGFRHGPKIVISPETLVIYLRSADPYTSKYDQDLLDELRSDGIAGSVIELSLERLFKEANEPLEDIWLSLVCIVYCQIFAFMKSYLLGNTVDSPCPSGEVNRVVHGVIIHDYHPKSKIIE